MSNSAFSWNAVEFLRFKNDHARFLNELTSTGAEFVLVGSALLKELTLLTMFAGAGLFRLGGQKGLPERERLCSGMGSRNEQVMRRSGTCGLG